MVKLTKRNICGGLIFCLIISAIGISIGLICVAIDDDCAFKYEQLNLLADSVGGDCYGSPRMGYICYIFNDTTKLKCKYSYEGPGVFYKDNCKTYEKVI